MGEGDATPRISLPGSVLNGMPNPARARAIEDVGAPLSVEGQRQVQDAYNRASPARRAAMSSRTDFVGGASRALDRLYEEANPSALRALGERKEDVVGNRIAQGEVPSVAEDSYAYGYGKDRNVARAEKSNYDFDAASEAKTDGFVERGFDKGVASIKAGMAGVNQIIGGAISQLGQAAEIESVDEFGRRLEGGSAQQYKAAQRRLEAIGDNPDKVQNFIETGISGAMNLIPMLAGPSAGFATMGALATGNGFAASSANGASYGDALRYGAAVGMAEIIGERLGLPSLQKLFVQNAKEMTPDSLANFFTDYIKYNLKEQGSEQVTNALSFGADKWMAGGLQPNATLNDYIKSVFDTAYQTLATTMLVGGAGAGVRATANRFATDKGLVSSAIQGGVDSREFDKRSIDAAVIESMRGSDPRYIDPSRTTRAVADPIRPDVQQAGEQGGTVVPAGNTTQNPIVADQNSDNDDEALLRRAAATEKVYDEEGNEIPATAVNQQNTASEPPTAVDTAVSTSSTSIPIGDPSIWEPGVDLPAPESYDGVEPTARASQQKFLEKLAASPVFQNEGLGDVKLAEPDEIGQSKYDSLRQIVRTYKKLFNVDVVLADFGEGAKIHGYYDTPSGKVVLNVRSADLTQAISHEAFHAFEKKHADLFAPIYAASVQLAVPQSMVSMFSAYGLMENKDGKTELGTAVDALVANPADQAARQKLATILSDPKNALARSELLAHMVGQAATPAMYAELVRRSGSASKANKIIQTLTDFLNGLYQKLFGRTLDYVGGPDGLKQVQRMMNDIHNEVQIRTDKSRLDAKAARATAQPAPAATAVDSTAAATPAPAANTAASPQPTAEQPFASVSDLVDALKAKDPKANTDQARQFFNENYDAVVREQQRRDDEERVRQQSGTAVDQATTAVEQPASGSVPTKPTSVADGAPPLLETGKNQNGALTAGKEKVESIKRKAKKQAESKEKLAVAPSASAPTTAVEQPIPANNEQKKNSPSINNENQQSAPKVVSPATTADAPQNGAKTSKKGVMTRKQAEDKLDELSIDPETKKSQVMTLAKKMIGAGLMPADEMGNLEQISKDRDMGPEDLISEMEAYVREEANNDPSNSLFSKKVSPESIRSIDELVNAANSASSWRYWYDTYQGVLRNYFGEDTDLFQKLLSATSQATSVPANVTLALKAYRQLISGEEFTGYLPAVIKNLNRIRDREALSGEKISEYGKAVDGDGNGIAVDRHIAELLFSTKAPSPAQIAVGKRIIREVAGKLGWAPREVQASLWAYNQIRKGGRPASYDTYLERKADEIRRLRSGREGQENRGDPELERSAEPRQSPAGEAGVREGTGAANEKFSRQVLTNVLVDAPVRPISDFIDELVVPTFADLTVAGGAIVDVDGSVIIPVEVDGGPNYPALEKTSAKELVWAIKGKGAVSQFAKHKKGAKYVVVIAMGQDAHKSNATVNTVFVRALESFASDGRFSQETLSKLTEHVKNSKQARRQTLIGKALTGMPDLRSLSSEAGKTEFENYLASISFEARSVMSDLLSSATAEKIMGVPLFQKVLRLTIEPEFAGVRLGAAVALLEVDRKSPVVELDGKEFPTHMSYKYGVRGRLVAKFEKPVSMELLFPEFIARRRTESTSPSNDYRSLSLKRPVVNIPRTVRSLDEKPVKNIKNATHLSTLLDALDGNWTVLEKKPGQKAKTAGLAEYVRGLRVSEASSTLTPYTDQQLKKEVSAGTVRIFRLGDHDIWFGLRKKEGKTELFGVYNNEQGVPGVVGLILRKAVQEGANLLDAYSVKSKAYPDGRLPTIYGGAGFKASDSYSFDPSYLVEYDTEKYSQSPEYREEVDRERHNKLLALRAYWESAGWKPELGPTGGIVNYPDVVVMERKDGSTEEGSGPDNTAAVGRVQPSGVGEAASGGRQDSEPADQQRVRQARDGSDDAGDVRGLSGGNERVVVTRLDDRLEDTLREAVALTDADIVNLGQTPERVRAIAEKVGPELRFSRQIESPQLKQWFGDSKIVNEDGTPKVMYHGTARDITEFRPKQANAIFVTDKPAFAADFSDMSAEYMEKKALGSLTKRQREAISVSVQANIKRNYPKDAGIGGDLSAQLKDWVNGVQEPKGELLDYVQYSARKQGKVGGGQNILPLFVKAENPWDFDNPAQVAELRDWLKSNGVGWYRQLDDVQSRPNNWSLIEDPKTQEGLKVLGFDSFYVKEGGVKNLAVYNPTQLKSAIGNNGDFDLSNPDIRFSKLIALSHAAIDQMNRHSPVVLGKSLGRTSQLSEDLAFQRRVEIIRGVYDKMPAGYNVPVPSMVTSNAMRISKMPQQAVTWSFGILEKVLFTKHAADFDGVTAAEINRSMRDPVAILKSSRAPDEFDIITDIVRTNEEGKTGPIVIVVKTNAVFNPEGFAAIKHTAVKSAYIRPIGGKDNVSDRISNVENIRYLELGRAREVFNQAKGGRFPEDAIKRELSKRRIPDWVNVVAEIGDRYTGPVEDMPLFSRPLTEAEREVESNFRNDLRDNYEAKKAEYWRDSPGTLDVDKARDLSPEYKKEPSKYSAAVHEPASDFIKQLYGEQLSSMPKGSIVLFSAGGGGSGKGYILGGFAADISRAADLVYDTTMSGFESGQRRIQAAIDAGHKVSVVLVYRDPVAALNGAIGRAAKTGRVVPINVMAKDHAAGRDAVKKLVEYYAGNPSFSAVAVDNNGTTPKYVSIDQVEQIDENRVLEDLYDELDRQSQNPELAGVVAAFRAASPVRPADQQRVGRGRRGEVAGREDAPVRVQEGQASGRDARENQGGQDGLLSRKVLTQGNKFTLPERSISERISNKFANEVSRVEDIQKEIVKQGGLLTDKSNVQWAQTRMYRKSAQEVDRFREEKVYPLMRRIARAGIQLDDLAMYLYANHAEKRNAYIASINPQFPDGGSGMFDAEAKQKLTSFRARPDYQTFKALAKELQSITAATGQVLLNGGLVDQNQISAWRNTYGDTYVPLKGWEDIDESMKVSHRSDPRVPFAKRALGRGSRAGQIIENIMGDYERAIVAVEKNNVRKAFYRFVLDNPDEQLWQPQRIILTKRFNKGAVMSPLAMAQGNVTYSATVDNREGHTVAVRIGGQLKSIWVADEAMLDDLSQAIDAVDGDTRLAMRTLMGINRTLAKSYTALSPAFVLTNATRDLQTALLATGIEKKGGLWRAAKITAQLIPLSWNIWRATRNNEWTAVGNRYRDAYIAMRDAGGAQGFMGFMDLQDRQRNLNQIIEETQNNIRLNPKSWYIEGRKMIRVAHDFIMDLNGAIEGAARVAAYAEAIKAGETKESAVNTAANVTTDFARRGKWTPWLSGLWLFANPAIQGARRVAALAFSRKGAAFTGSLVTLGYMTAMMSAGATGDDDEPYWDKPDVQDTKLKNLLFFDPQGNQYKIPLAYGWGFFVNVGYALADIQRGKATGRAAAFLTNSVFQHFSPLGSTENMASFFAPTLLDLVVPLATNMTDRGRELMPSNSFGKEEPNSERYWSSTRGTYTEKATTWLNEVTGGSTAVPGYISVSPESVNHVRNFIFGGAGQFVADTASSIYLTATLGGSTAVEKNKVPILKSFYRTKDIKGEQGAFFENSKEALQALNEAKTYWGKEDNTTAVQERLDQNGGLAALGRSVQSYNKALSNLRKEEMMITDNKDMSDVDKESIRSDIDQRRKQLYDDFNRMFYAEKSQIEK